MLRVLGTVPTNYLGKTRNDGPVAHRIIVNLEEWGCNKSVVTWNSKGGTIGQVYQVDGPALLGGGHMWWNVGILRWLETRSPPLTHLSRI